MPFVREGVTLIRDAFERGYTLPAFNVCSAEMVRACLEAAEAEAAPIILQTYPADLEQIAPRQLAALVKSYAEEADVPVTLHLDHGPDFKLCVECLAAGYSSVMYDGADADLEGVLVTTGRLAEVTRLLGASLEVANDSFNAGSLQFSRPGEVAQLFEAGADMVAVSIGSEHGQSGELDFGLLKEIAERVNAPLVMHGGSGITADEHERLRAAGVVKTNIGSALYRALRGVWEGSSGASSHRDVYSAARTSLREVAADKIRLLGAAGRA